MELQRPLGVEEEGQVYKTESVSDAGVKAWNIHIVKHNCWRLLRLTSSAAKQGVCG